MIVPFPPIDQSVIAGVVAGLAVLLIIGGLVVLRRERAFRQRLRGFIAANVGEHVPAVEISGGPEGLSLLQQMSRGFNRSQVSAGIRRQLVRAGSPLHAGQFVWLRVLSTIGGGVIVYPLSAMTLPFLQPLVIVAGIFVGWVVPMAIVRAMQRRRVRAFERHLPDAIDIMAGSLEAGSSLPMALEMVSREMPPPVSTEFARALREVSLGMALDDALLNMLDRVYSDDLDMFATAVAIQYRVGGNLADVLKVIAHTIRERVRIRGDILTLTAQQTISANILILLPIALAALLFVLNPEYEMRLFDPGFPRLATASAVVMIAVAYVLLKRIVSIDA